MSNLKETINSINFTGAAKTIGIIFLFFLAVAIFIFFIMMSIKLASAIALAIVISFGLPISGRL